MRLIRLSVVLLLTPAVALLTATAVEAAPKRANPAWVQTCVDGPVLAGPWKRFTPDTICRLIHQPPRGRQ